MPKRKRRFEPARHAETGAIIPGVSVTSAPRIWGGVETRLIGVHGRTQEVVRWDQELPHASFLRAIEQTAPHVLEELHVGGLAGIAAWAERYELTVPWMLDVARATVGAGQGAGFTLPRTVVIPSKRRAKCANPRDLERLVRWHVLRWQTRRIAQQELDDGQRGDLENRERDVREAVKELHKRLALPPRSPGRGGRPRVVPAKPPP